MDAPGAYGTSDVARLTGLSPEHVRAMVRARYVEPTRDRRGGLRFTFQDLIVLRAARSLRAARVPARRIGAALRALRAQLPEDAPAGAFTVAAEGSRVVVREAGRSREATSGQYLLSFEIGGDDDRVHEVQPRTAPTDCEAMFRRALELEDTDVEAAIEAYGRCITEHGDVAAHVNRGRLLHEAGRIEEAIEVYRAVREPDSLVMFNLGVALQDLDRVDEAIAAYEAALREDPGLADAHFNLAQLHDRAGDRRAALRHRSAFRRLTRQGN